MIFSAAVIDDLIGRTGEQRAMLQEVYAKLPATRCGRRARCCTLLPEMNLLEALSALERIRGLPAAESQRVTRRIVEYFFVNAVEISSCPFLENRACLIYPDRFFGCRAYGLWSSGYYERIAAGSREAKREFQAQWKRLGVTLPREVMEFTAPYCTSVEIEGEASVDDEDLLQAARDVDSLSGKCGEWHQLFASGYFSDLSFLVAALSVGIQEAARMKFGIVRDIAGTGDRGRLEDCLERILDLRKP